MMIKIITSFLSLLYFLLVGTPTAKNSLHKKPTHADYRKSVNCWVQMNFGIIALAAILILLIIFIVSCFMIVGVSATESGMLRNFINGGVI